MPKHVEFEGASYEFPDDATDEEITALMNQQHPAEQAKAATPETPSGPPSALSVVAPTVLAMNNTRPVINAVANKVAGGMGSGVARVAGRIAGGAAGGAMGGALGITGGPVTGFGGAGMGLSIGGSMGNAVGKKVGSGLQAVGKAVATATDTAPAEQVISPSVRSATGKFMKGSSKLVDLPLPIGRRMVDAFGKMVPALDRASMVSSLYDQQPSDPNDTFLQSIVRKTPGVLKDPLGIGTGAGAFPINPFDHHYTADNYDFPVQHYKDDLVALRDRLIAYLGKK